MYTEVYIVKVDTNCIICGKVVEKGEFAEQQIPDVGWEREYICLKCAGLDKLVYLPSGDAALTRRARKNSEKYAIVLRYNISKRRAERKGILVEQAALKKAQKECQADQKEREKKQEKARQRRVLKELEYMDRFAAEIRRLYPSCPEGVEDKIASHACEVSSDRVGRSREAKQLDEEMIRRAVVAHIRHHETIYDDLYGSDYCLDKNEARESVADFVREIHDKWKQPLG